MTSEKINVQHISILHDLNEAAVILIMLFTSSNAYHVLIILYMYNILKKTKKK